jgi:Tol biopolymer transport system component
MAILPQIDVQFAWYNRDGTRLQNIGEPGASVQIALSPDERRLAMERFDPHGGGVDLWVLDLSTGVSSRQTSPGGASFNTAWSADGRELIFHSIRNGKVGIYRKMIGGGEEQGVAPDQEGWPYGWMKDGKSIILVGGNARSFLQLSLSDPAKPVVLFNSKFGADIPRLSPDEHWIAYNSAEIGPLGSLRG